MLMLDYLCFDEMEGMEASVDLESVLEDNTIEKMCEMQESEHIEKTADDLYEELMDSFR